jgi:hypothetical protein
MSKTKIAGVAALAVLVLYIANTTRGSMEAADARIAASSATLYKNCKLRSETTDDLGLDAEQEDCAERLLQAN